MTTNKDESNLFIASNTTSLEDFLKTAISFKKHVYCCFPKRTIDFSHLLEFEKRQLLSVSFQDAHTIYPPFRK